MNSPFHKSKCKSNRESETVFVKNILLTDVNGCPSTPSPATVAWDLLKWKMRAADICHREAVSHILGNICLKGKSNTTAFNIHIIKCVNNFFHHFSLFFLVFHGFSSFLFVFCRFSSIQIYSHSKLKQVLQTSVQFSLQHKILYVQPPFPTFWFWKTLPFQLLLISKYCNCKWNLCTAN